MSWWELVLVGVAGGLAGLINTVVGSGTLITFPTLLALGVPPVLANVSNSIGLAPGSLSAVLASRPELAGQRSRIIRYGSASLVGSVIGALVLLRLPAATFSAVVPVLIGLACVLVIIGPWVTRWVAERRDHLDSPDGPPDGPWWMWPVIVLTGAYGGYFGAAQGVLVLAVLGLVLADPIARVNGLKNVLVGIANAVAGIVFVVVSTVDWAVVAALAVGSVLGAQVGVRVGRRLPPRVYRVIIVAIGMVAIIALLVR